MELTKRYRRVVQIELNEISSEIIRSMITKGQLPNFRRIQSQWSFAETSSETRYELIEPWIQWVTAHTGKSYEEHGIFRLGDIDALQHPQIWEVLSESGIESAILGCMNVSRGKACSGGFFFPDPWSKDGIVYPPELQPLWNMISKKVQGHAVSPPKILDSVKVLKLSAKFGIPLALYARIAKQFLEQKLDPLSKWRLAALFDEFLSEIFLTILDKPNYRFCAIFLNAIAHYQHHYWRNFDRKAFSADVLAPDCNPNDNPIEFGYLTYDRILGKILNKISLDDTLVLIVSGLSQIPFNLKDSEGGMNYYRLKDHQLFLQKCGIGHAKAFPMMSRDWQIRVNADEDYESVHDVLLSVNINGSRIFAIERKSDGFMFLETSLTRQVQVDEIISIGSKPLGKFHEIFVNIAVKSGHHTGIGSLWISEAAPADKKQSVIPLSQVFEIGRSALLQ